jgi:hypothetical protein
MDADKLEELERLTKEVTEDNGEPLYLRFVYPDDGEGDCWIEYKNKDSWQPLWEHSSNDRPGSIYVADAALIVAAINALPELVAMAKELDAARAELAGVREAAGPFVASLEADVSDSEDNADILRPSSAPYNRAPLLTVGDLRRLAAALAKDAT